jgi:putative membrane protein
LDNEKKESSSVPWKKHLALKNEEPPFMKISFRLLKVGITSLHKEFRSNFSFFVTAYENSRNFIEHSDFDEKKIDAYLDRGLVQSAAVIVILMLCSILIINLIRTVF